MPLKKELMENHVPLVSKKLLQPFIPEANFKINTGMMNQARKK